MLKVIVSEYMLGNTAISYTLNHRSVITGVRENMTTWQRLGQSE